MVFDLVRFAVSGKDTKEIILSRMKSIEKYLKSLNSRKVELFVIDETYDADEPKPNGYDDAFDIKFSTLSYYLFTVHIYPSPCPSSSSSWNWNLFYRKLETEEMKEKFRDFSALLDEALLFK